MTPKNIIVVVIALSVVGGGVAIVGSSMSSGVFSLTLKQVLDAPAKLETREFKVVGNVVAGSIKKGANQFEIDFVISDKEGRRLACHFKGSVPDPFAEGREVILQGRLADSGAAPGDLKMEVSKITVKCPSKYEEAGMNEDEFQDYYKQKYKNGHRKE
ncbi:MAG: cytochrome c maturation protein CcmE [Deltaproteobacteria bacterium]|nr:cytochrome c maturation protein CcmE [Deltaproteobacteria bacterium]